MPCYGSGVGCMRCDGRAQARGACGFETKHDRITKRVSGQTFEPRRVA